jgi:hypothetical protein
MSLYRMFACGVLTGLMQDLRSNACCILFVAMHVVGSSRAWSLACARTRHPCVARGCMNIFMRLRVGNARKHGATRMPTARATQISPRRWAAAGCMAAPCTPDNAAYVCIHACTTTRPHCQERWVDETSRGDRECGLTRVHRDQLLLARAH